MREVTYGTLRARVTGGEDGNGRGDGAVIVLLHGFGAPGHDLVGLAGALPGVPPQTRWVFPEAPLALGAPYGDGRAWWMLDIEMLQRRAQGERIERSHEVPEGLAEARNQVRELLDAVSADLKPPAKGLILGGFSQGSMVSCDVALHDTRELAGLVLLSSTLISQQDWEPRMSSRKGLPIFQSHGKDDPILAYSDALRLRDLWQAAEAQVSFVEFAGGHGIPPQVMTALGSFLQRLISASKSP